MSDVSQGPGWWLASDGKWYPPKEPDQAPAPGWWLAADGKWYPPVDSADPPAPGWWLAADGKWYPPQEPTAADPATAEVSSPNVAPAEPAPAPADPRPAAAPTAHQPLQPHQPHEPRGPRSVDEVTSRGAVAPTGDANEQIRVRNDASRQDAIAQAPARFLAASRAMRLLEAEKASLADTETPSRTGSPTPDAIPVPTPAASAPVAEAPAELPAAPPPAPPAPPAAPTGGGAAQVTRLEAFAPASARGEEPIIELRTSPLGADIDHIGDRLLVFADRVELRDRSDRVRQTLDGSDITDVVVTRKFTGALLVVETGDGRTISTRGLRPEQADEAKAVIHKTTRQGRPAVPRSDDAPTTPTTSTTTPSTTTAPTGSAGPDAAAGAEPDATETAARLAVLNRGRLNEADLLRKLADLHRAGVLTDAEFEDKIALVGRLVSGESLVVS